MRFKNLINKQISAIYYLNETNITKVILAFQNMGSNFTSRV